MKKVVFLLVVLVMVMTSFVFAKDKEITKVEILDIDSPFEKTRTLDTSGRVPYPSSYRIFEIAWNKIAATQYEVTVTVTANKGCIFSGDIEATINENPATSQEIVEKDEFKLSYVFTEKSETTISSDTLRYRILAYYDTNKGLISPNGARPLRGEDQTFKIIPNEGYQIKEVVVDGISQGVIDEYSFTNVRKGHEIRAYFEKVTASEASEENATNVNTAENKPILQFLLDLIKLFQL